MIARRRAIAVSLISAALYLAQSSPASAETLVVTDDGREYVGDVIDAGVNTLTMKLGGTGYQIVRLKSIVRVKIDVGGSSPIEGQLIDWKDGEAVVRVGDRDVGIRDGIVTSVVDIGVAAGGPKLSAPTEPAADDQSPAAEPSTPGNAPTNATM